MVISLQIKLLIVVENEDALRKSYSLKAIYSEVDKNIVKIINTSFSAKGVWDTVEVAQKM